MQKLVQTNQQNVTTIWNRQYLFLVLLNILNNVSFYLIISAISLYTKSELAWSTSMVGVFSGCYAISALVFRPVGGVLADTVGKKKLMLFGSIFTGLAVLAYGYFSSFALLIVVRILHGVAYSMTNTAITAAVVYTIPRAEMNKGIGYFGLALIIAQAIAPGIGLDIAEAAGYRWVFTIAAAISLFSGGLLLVGYRDPATYVKGRKPSWKGFFAKECVAYAAIGAAISATNGIFSTYLVLSAAQHGIAKTALAPFYWVNGLALICARLIVGKAGDKKGTSRMLYTAFALCAACVVLMLRSDTVLMFCVVGILKGLGTGLAIPALQAACLSCVSRERSGVASSTYYIGADAGNGLGPIVAGKIVDYTPDNYSGAYIFNLMALLAGVVGYFFYSRKQQVTQSSAVPRIDSSS